MMDQVQKYVFPSIFNPVSHTLLNSVLWPVLSKQFSSWSERQSSARPPRPEVSQSHPRVTKRSSSRSSARRPRLQVPQRHPVVAKGASSRSSARRPRPEVSQSHLRVTKRSSDRSLARQPCPQVPQRHPRVEKRDFWPVFGTATLPTGTSVASRRGEGGF